MLHQTLGTKVAKPRSVHAAFLGLLLSALAGTSSATTQSGPELLVLGGDVAEIVAELGAAEQVIARDDTVTYPPALSELPSVGYLRNLSGESVLGLRPDAIIASQEAGPSEVLTQIEASGVSLTLIQPPAQTDALPQWLNSKIRQVASALDHGAQGEALIEQLASQYQQVDALPALHGLKVMFLLHHGGMTPMVGGHNSSADRVINRLGASNAFADVEGYKPVSAEGLIPAAPDVVVLPKEGLDALGGEQGLWQLPGLALTPAGKRQHYVSVDSVALLSVTPRTPQALLDLHRALSEIHPAEAP